jgi:hypothetical protein
VSFVSGSDEDGLRVIGRYLDYLRDWDFPHIV